MGNSIWEKLESGRIDWVLVLALLPILGGGLVTMSSFTGEENYLTRQLLWIGLSFVVFFVFSFLDVRFIKRTNVLMTVYGAGVLLLISLFVIGSTVKGATSWINLGVFSLQPSDPMKIILILLLAKYFSRRHMEIKNPKHIIVSGIYFMIPFTLIFLQPDFGSAAILFLIWFGLVLVSGISKKHLALILGGIVLAAGVMWMFVLQPYQQDRILSFLDPLADIQGAGYNAYQSTIAVGSGQLLGKGVGFGTQSRLKFLPEYQTDFIFAAFAEEWGFVGSILILLLIAVVVWRVLRIGNHAASNFETLFAFGFAIMIMSHVLINVGMNIGLLPVTGITLPFLSYGGSHLITLFAGLGILMSMRSYGRGMRRDVIQKEALDSINI